MKNCFLSILFLSFFATFSQQEISKKVIQLISKNTKFEAVSPLSASTNISDFETSKVVDKATFAKINLSEINKIVANKYENIELKIPYQGKSIAVQLYKVNLFAEGFHVDTDKSKNINYQKGTYYRGIIKEDLNSVACFNFFENECNGIISSNELSNLVIGKLEKANNISDYVIYRDEDLKISTNLDCHTKDVAQSNDQKNNENQKNTQSTRCVTMYFEIDNNLYQSNSSNSTTTTNWMTSVYNNVQTLYNNDGITVSLKSLYIWTTPDPYEGIGTSSTDYKTKFHEIRPIFDGDVGQLIGIDPGGLGGVADTINGLCNSNNHSYSDVNFTYISVPTYSWTIQVITHEFGHLLGSPHTHACAWNGNNTPIDNCGPKAIGSTGEGYSCYTPPGIIPSTTTKGTIMSYCHLISGVGISFNNGFGPQPKAKILNAVNNGTCLSTDCINTCVNKISSSNISNITNTTAAINWSEIGGTISAEISVFPISASSGTWTTPATNPYILNALLPNTYYKVLIRNVCSAGLIGPQSALVFATNGDFCSGITLTDSGGITGDYKDDETIIRTIIPSNPSAKAKITFTVFDLEKDYDYLHVYNGSDTTFPELSGTLGFTGNTIPAPIESTATDGSLTLKFVSDPGVVGAGYEATVSCSTILGTNDFASIIDFSYYPNPTTNSVSITSKTEISSIAVYNIAGQLLYQNKLDNLKTNVDISSFETGTYFFKLKFGEKEVNFKILKM